MTCREMVTLTRHYDADPTTVWRLWTTADGIARWWAPDGFRTDVESLDLRPDGELVYTMTAVDPAQVEFMTGAGLPLSTRARKTFTEIDEPRRLAYRSLIDFVPDHEPYDHLTIVDLRPGDGGTDVTMTMESLHDEDWTQRLVGGRSNELDNLGRLLDHDDRVG